MTITPLEAYRRRAASILASIEAGGLTIRDIIADTGIDISTATRDLTRLIRQKKIKAEKRKNHNNKIQWYFSLVAAADPTTALPRPNSVRGCKIIISENHNPKANLY